MLSSIVTLLATLLTQGDVGSVGRRVPDLSLGIWGVCREPARTGQG